MPFVVLDPMDVGREGVDVLDKFFALGAVFGVATEVGLALSSSVELSIDCIAASSAGGGELQAEPPLEWSEHVGTTA